MCTAQYPGTIKSPELIQLLRGQFLALLDFLQLQMAFQEKEDENLRLKHYIDTILLNIVENYPQILEVKNVGGPEKR